MGALLALQRPPERGGAVGRITIAEGAGNQQHTGRTLQLAWADRLHATELYLQPCAVQTLCAALGQRLAIAGLRGPQHLMSGRAGGHGQQHAGRLRGKGGGAKVEGIDALAGNPLKGHGAVLEGRLQRQRVDRIAGHGIDCQVLADHIVPVERREAIARHDPVADTRRQHGPATARADRHLVLVLDTQPRGILGVEFDKGAGLQPVQRRYLAGLGQGVPLVLHAAGIEHQRVIGVRQLRRGQPGPGEEAGLATGCGEHKGRGCAFFDVTHGAAVVHAARRARPLVRLVTQLRVADPTQVVTGERVVEAADFVIHRFGVGVIEGLGITHGTGDPGDDLPVRQALAWCSHGARHQCEVAFAVDHHALTFSPEGGGQENVGVRVGFGVEKGILGDHKLRLAQAIDHLLAVGDAGHRVAADDPAGLHFTRFHLLEQRYRALAAFCTQAAGCQAPLRFDKAAVGVDQRRTLARQSRPHVAHLTATHGIGLAGQRERPTAGAADGAGGQVQVAQRIGMPGAVHALVQAHGPAAHPFTRAADQRGSLADVIFCKAGDGRDALRRVVLEEGRQCLPALGVAGNEGAVCLAIAVQQVQQAVEQGQVAAGAHLQEQVGLVGGGGAPRVDNDQFRSSLYPVEQAQEEDRMAVGHVGTDHQEHLGTLEVLVTAGRAIGPQRKFVAAAGAGHAQA
ncbi:hypothetical protein D3C78_586100 [compost metagenome]